MTPQAFKNSWTNADEPLSPLSKSRLDRFDLLKSTSDFFRVAGLPGYCKPHLSFANDTDDIYYGISKLTEQYDFEEDEPRFAKYIVIGSAVMETPLLLIQVIMTKLLSLTTGIYSAQCTLTVR